MPTAPDGNQALVMNPPENLSHIKPQIIDIPSGNDAVVARIIDYLYNTTTQISCQMTDWPNFFVYRSSFVDYFLNPAKHAAEALGTGNSIMTEMIFKGLFDIADSGARAIEVQGQFSSFFKALDIVGLCQKLNPIIDYIPNACIAFALYQGLIVMGGQTILDAKSLTTAIATSETREISDRLIDIWALKYSAMQQYSANCLMFVKYLSCKYAGNTAFWASRYFGF